jgi:hypothetical protein
MIPDIRNTDKDNAKSQADTGELNATASPTDSTPPPRSDSDSFPSEPGVPMVGPPANDSEAHNSPGVVGTSAPRRKVDPVASEPGVGDPSQAGY